MSVEDNKKVVLDFFENMSASRVAEALALLDDNATVTVMARPESLAFAGTKTKAEFAALQQAVAQRWPKGRQITPKGLTAEDDRVAVEAESYGELTDGKVYNNLYHFLFEVRDGKIQAVREYCDTLHAKEMLLS